MYNLVVMDFTDKSDEAWTFISIVNGSANVPVLALYDGSSGKDTSQLLLSGATVCLEKPLREGVCRAQVVALLCTFPAAGDEQKGTPLLFGLNLVVIPRYRQVYLAGQILKLTRLEYEWLFFLAKHPGQIFSNEEIYDNVWPNTEKFGSEDAVKTCIKTLRKKLAGIDRVSIENVCSVGYRFNG